MNQEDLPKLPDGMYWEKWADCWTAVDDMHGGAVTISFDRRNFGPGWLEPYKKTGDFSGRGWKEKLVAAAVAALRGGST